MNAVTHPVVVTSGRARVDVPLGLVNLVRKDVGEWAHGRRAWVVLAVSLLVLLLTAANAALNHWILANVAPAPGDIPPKLLSLAPDDNLLAAVGTQFPIIVAILATMSILVSERDTGTLAWTVSKPVSRTAVLLSKWASATVLLWLTAVVLPLIATATLIGVLYGPPNLVAVATMAVGLGGAIALFVAIAVVAATFVPTQAGVAAIGLAAFIVPPIVSGIVPALSAVVPTSIYGWVVAAAMGAAVPVATPIALLAALTALFVLGRNRFSAMEL